MELQQFWIRTDKLNELYEIWKKIKTYGEDRPPSVLRTAQAEKILEKVLLHCRSIIRLFDVVLDDCTEADIALIASAARNIMDSGNVYFYVTERGISEEEVNFRYNLQIMNYDRNIKDISKKLEFPQDCFRMWLLDHDFVIDEIKESSIYRDANEQDRKRILSGKQFFKKKRPGIFTTEMESAIFNLLSNSVHSFYIGLSNNSVNKSAVFMSYIDAVMLCMISVETAVVYMANILNDYLQLRKQLVKALTAEEKKKIKELMSTEYIETYLEAQRKEFGKELFQINRKIFP